VNLLDKHTIKTAIVPVDLNTAANTGARISLAPGDRVGVLIHLGASLTGANVVVALKQHDAASAGNSKALEVARPYFKKTSAATHFTKVDVDTATDEYDLSTDFDTLGGLIYFEVESQDLDVSGGFTHFSVDVEDAAVAKVGSASYIVSDLRSGPGYSVDV
jgi:hypothetical protein